MDDQTTPPRSEREDLPPQAKRFLELHEEVRQIKDAFVRNDWWRAHQHEYTEARAVYESWEADRRRREDEDARRERRRAQEERRLAEAPNHPNAIPTSWIIDEGWARLSPAAKAVTPVIYRLIDPARNWTQISRATIARLSGYSERSVSRGIREATTRGWFRHRVLRIRAGGSVPLFALPPPGDRQEGEIEERGEDDEHPE